MTLDVRRSLKEIERLRVERGVCRHCGGRVPCWSEFGDRAVGKRHTAASFRRVREVAS